MVQRILVLIFFIFCTALNVFGFGEKIDNSPLAKIKRDIEALSDEKLEGRLTGTDGEMAAANYIENRFKQIGIDAYKGKYKWDFTSKGNTKLGKNAYFKIFNDKLSIGSDVIFMPYSKGNSITGFAYPNVFEEDNCWLVSLKQISSYDLNNPQKSIYQFAKNAIEKGAKSVVFFNDINTVNDLASINLNKFDALTIPVAFINYDANNKYIKPNLKKDWIEIDANYGYEDVNATGKNVVSYINNNSPFTIVIGAHYDHIGENFAGANNNASGVAGLLQIAELIKIAKITQYNFLFIAFSGNEQNLQGSKSFLSQNEAIISSYSFMINLDMIGRLTSKNIFVSGTNTSPNFYTSLSKSNTTLLTLNIDSSGYGYSDYREFYIKKVPVLNFSTGFDEDYLTKEDTKSKINYIGILEISNYVFRVVDDLRKQAKQSFNLTNDILPKLKKLNVDLGILFDFSFDKNGIKIATCKPNKIASKSGLKSGDVITKIGEFPIIDFDDYEEAIKKTNKEKETTVLVKRENIEYKFFMLLKE